MSLLVYAREMRVLPATTPHLGERRYIELDLDLTAAQHRDLLVRMLLRLSDDQVRDLLRSEMPGFLNPEERDE